MNWTHIFFICEIYIMLALGANLLSGYTGLVSFANGAFYGLGAYATALSMKVLGLGFLEATLIAVLCNLLLAMLVALLSIRLKDLYFTLATLALQVVVFTLLYNWEELTGGSYGISDIPKADILGYVLNRPEHYVILGAFFAAATALFFSYFRKTPLFRTLECIRDNELGAVTMGKNLSYYKILCNLMAATIMAVAGSLFAAYHGYIDPTAFTLAESILIVNMILIGGTGNLIGPVFGACFFVLLPEVTRLIPVSSSQGASLQLMIYSAILILVVRLRPNGLFGEFRFR